MKKTSAILALAFVLIPGTLLAAPAHKMSHKTSHSAKAKTAAMYVCTKCHMTYSAAEAKKDHYKCPMDGGKLVPQTKASSKKTM